MRIALIAAVAENGVIGRDNQMPWHLPNDLRFFKATTMGKPIIMGRKTFESLGRPLPGRANIVITRNATYAPQGVQIVRSLDEALAMAATIAERDGQDEVMVIGGGEIYRQALPLAARLYLTEVHANVEGDATFPAWERSAYRELSREGHPAEGNNPYSYSFVVYEKLPSL